MKHIVIAGAFTLAVSGVFAQETNTKEKIDASVSKVWVSDLGNGTFKNPVLNADYSDPDACRVGEDFYMIASSFDAVPGLPILHSKDLVNWKLIGHALNRQPPIEHFEKTQHGMVCGRLQ